MISRQLIGIGTVLLAAGIAPDLRSAEDFEQPEVGGRFENGIVAIVENRVITVGDVRRRIQPYLDQIARESRNAEEFRRVLEATEDTVIQGLVDDYLIVKDFYSDEKRRLPSSIVDNEYKEELINEFDGDRSKFLAYLDAIGKTRLEYRDLLTERIIVQYMESQKQRARTIISPVKIENYYMQHRDQFFEPDAMHVRLILLKKVANETDAVLEQTAQTIMERLRAGADFAALAREFSQDSTRERGGDWGWIPRGEMREELAEAAFALEKGQFTEPIRLNDQIFILKLEDKRVAGIQPLDNVRTQIEAQIVNQMDMQARERWLERLRRNAYVRYFN